MADYTGVWFLDPATFTPAIVPITRALIDSRDATGWSAGGSPPVIASSQTVVPLDLPDPLPHLFMHDWSSGCEIETTFQVDVTRAISLSEDRRLLADRPTRTIHARYVGLNRVSTLKALMNLFRHGYTRCPVPVYTDHSAVSSASLKVVNCETDYRRFFAGQRVVLCTFSKFGIPENVEFAQIDNVVSGYLVLLNDLVNTYTTGARVYPLMDAEFEFALGAVLKSDQLSEMNLRLTEIPGPSTMPATASGTPTGFEEYDDLPILAVHPEASFDYHPGMIRAGSLEKQGRGRIVYVQGDAPQATYNLTYRGLSRAAVWPLVQLSDSRRGRTRGFWLVSPQTMFNPTVITTAHVVVDIDGNIEDVETFFSSIAIVLDDGTITIRGISNVVLDGGEWRIDFDVALTSAPALADVHRVTAAHRVRFQDDSRKETWYTDETCDITFEMQDLVEEKEVVLICLQ